MSRIMSKKAGRYLRARPEFAHPLSLYRTPLARVLPARPSGVVYEQGFVPFITDIGDRHPVTRAAWRHSHD